MAFNPSPQVAACREIARRFNKNQVIIIMLTDTTIEMATYGETRALCDKAGRLGNIAYDAVVDHYADGAMTEITQP